jgi:hypothetical protein
MKIAFSYISSEMNKKIFTERNALTSVTLSILLSFFFSSVMDSDNTYGQTGPLNTEKILTPIIPFPISMPFGTKSSSPVASSTLYDDFESGTYSLRDGQISPNGKWHNFYNGGGSSGVRYGGGGNSSLTLN